MKNLRKFLLGLLVVLVMSGLMTSQAQALNCLFQYPGYPAICLWWEPILLPNARWCQEGEAPGPNEVFIYASANYKLIPFPYCQALSIDSYFMGGTTNLMLRSYGMDGPSFAISSIRFGSNAMGWVYSEDDQEGTATYFSRGSASADTAGLGISSFYFYTFPNFNIPRPNLRPPLF